MNDRLEYRRSLGLPKVDEGSDLGQLIDEARGLAMLICPMAFQLEDGAEIGRMPDDLFRAANMIGRLCDELLALNGKGVVA